MALFVRDLVNTESPWIQIVEPRDEPAEVLLIDSFRGFPVDSRDKAASVSVIFAQSMLT
jgi:hypothetical protein